MPLRPDPSPVYEFQIVWFQICLDLPVGRGVWWSSRESQTDIPRRTRPELDALPEVRAWVVPAASTLPVDVPWKRMGFTASMMDTNVGELQFPALWRSSLAVSYHEPKTCRPTTPTDGSPTSRSSARSPTSPRRKTTSSTRSPISRNDTTSIRRARSSATSRGRIPATAPSCSSACTRTQSRTRTSRSRTTPTLPRSSPANARCTRRSPSRRDREPVVEPGERRQADDLHRLDRAIDLDMGYTKHRGGSGGASVLWGLVEAEGSGEKTDTVNRQVGDINRNTQQDGAHPEHRRGAREARVLFALDHPESRLQPAGGVWPQARTARCSSCSRGRISRTPGSRSSGASVPEKSKAVQNL